MVVIVGSISRYYGINQCNWLVALLWWPYILDLHDGFAPTFKTVQADLYCTNCTDFPLEKYIFDDKIKR